MGISERKEIEELLDLNDFRLKRSDGPHLVYSDGTRNFVMSKTPSDWRAHLNNIRDLKKVVIESGRVFKQIQDPKKEKAMSEFKNAPVIKDELKTKPLDAFAIESSRKWKEEGLRQMDILRKLLALKYTQPNNTRPIDQTTLSRTLRANNIRWNKYSSRGGKSAEEVPTSNIIHHIEELISSNLPVNLKEKFIINIVKEFENKT